jgi:hypothetical protein
MVWSKNGTTTLSSAGDTVTLSSLTASDFNLFIFHKIQVTGNVAMLQTFNNNTNTVYSRRGSNNGTAEFTSTNGSNWIVQHDISGDEFLIQYVCSISGKEKLAIMFTVSESTSGSGTAPTRKEQVGKFVPSPDADITRIDMNDTEAGSYDIGTNLSALTGDATEVALLPTNLQSGSRFEATDTRKIYYGALPSPDVDENFDSTGLLTWTDSDSAKITVDSSTNERLDFTFVRDSTTDETYHNLGSALSDTAWVMDFDLTLSTVNQGGGTDGNVGFIGIFSATGQSTQDGMHLQIISRSDYTRFRATASNDTTMLSEAISEGTQFSTVTPSVTTYYVRIVRDGNDCTVKFYSTADRTGTPTESQTETQSGITALQYISVRNLNFSAGNSTNNNLVGYIDNLKVYDGVTSVDFTWTEEA